MIKIWKELNCKTCKCTDKHAYKNGCYLLLWLSYWINENVCSACWLKNEKKNCECEEPEPDNSVDSLGFGGRFNRCKVCNGRVWH